MPEVRSEDLVRGLGPYSALNHILDDASSLLLNPVWRGFSPDKAGERKVIGLTVPNAHAAFFQKTSGADTLLINTLSQPQFYSIFAFLESKVI